MRLKLSGEVGLEAIFKEGEMEDWTVARLRDDFLDRMSDASRMGRGKTDRGAGLYVIANVGFIWRHVEQYLRGDSW